MARAKGMLNLSGNLEVNAQAPLDARTIVPTEADLTVANNFPYPYVGLEVYVTGTGKKFRLINLDTTQSSSWQEIGEGGGGSGLPSGGTTGQYLVKQSATEGDADWQSLSAFTGATSEAAGAAGLVPAPASGDEGKVLFGNGSWGNIVMPSVDYSQQSVEANIYSTTEKVIGQWTDGKLLYQKTIVIVASDFVQAGDFQQAMVPIISGSIVNVVNVKCFRKDATAIGKCNPVPYTNTITDNTIYNAFATINNNESSIFVRTTPIVDITNIEFVCTVQYTKTTDSPLASDEKFAGLTASGEVIYKKHGTFTLSDRITKWQQPCWDLSALFGLSNIKAYKVEGSVTGKQGTTGFGTVPICTRNFVVANNETYWFSTGFYYGINQVVLLDHTSGAGGPLDNVTLEVDYYYTKTS